jgi:hypothetical protein
VGYNWQELALENMGVISSLFLRARAWQIFFIFSVLFVSGIISAISTAGQLDEAPRIGLLFWAVSGLSELLLIAWLWSMGSFLSSIVHPALRLNAAFFRFTLIYPPLYAPVFVAFLEKQQSLVFAAVIPLHLFAMFCMFYNLYFVSKSLVLAETGRPTLFYDFAGPFFLVWFFPIGVWIVQPRINRLYAEHLQSHRK